MSDSAHNPDDYCYRHPDRLSFVLCERCGRTICLECQNHVDGRVLCPDDAAKVRSNVTSIAGKRRRKRLRIKVPAVFEGHPVVTYSIIAIVLVLFLVDLIARGIIMPHLWVLPPGAAPYDVLHQPWSLVTSMIASSSVLGLLLGGYSMYVLGRFIEPVVGSRNFVAVYVAGGLGASIFSFLLDGAVTSWFGATMGVAITAVVLARGLRVNPLFLYISCGISILLSFIFGGWQATIGGGLAGLGTGLYFYYADTPRRRGQVRIALIATGAALLVIGFVRAIAFPV
ncbi:MAG: gluP [Glaciihabitans sp.]|jgi:membrane associated rhomboid family serine protease|nr:gluP [Glaciihabitans sp.]